jgi:DNA-3-methyladenine glycosylase II
LCRWYSQDPSFVPSIHPRKLVGSPTKKRNSDTKPKKEEDRLEEGVGKLDELGGAQVEREEVIDLAEPKQEVEDETAVKQDGDEIENVDFVFPETSNGLTPQALKNRLAGKKIKGAYLTPQEMEELMKPWEPYRSIACWYLWSVTDKD